jgi:hypothetical protein
LHRVVYVTTMSICPLIEGQIYIHSVNKESVIVDKTGQNILIITELIGIWFLKGHKIVCLGRGNG